MLLGVGKKTPCVMRFSTTALERGSAEAVRDVKGMGVKFFTDDGIWDWVCLNIPMFFIRDPSKFPDMMHAQRRDPQTNLLNPNRWWNWVSKNPECLHLLLFQYCDFGKYFSWRSMSGYVAHAFKWVMADGSWKYVHFLLETDQGPKPEKGGRPYSSADPDCDTRELYESIERGEYPSWTAKVQVIDPKEAHKLPFNILDVTKHWKLVNYPTDLPIIEGRPFGKLTFKRKPKDYHTEIEQLAFSPSHLVPGVEPSEDPILQARMFAYPDAQRYRLGVNNQELPANRPRSSVSDPLPRVASRTEPDPERDAWLAEISSKAWSEPNKQDYKYAKAMWDVLHKLRGPEFQERLIENISKEVAEADPEVRKSVYSMFNLVDTDLEGRLRSKAEQLVEEKQKGSSRKDGLSEGVE